jgi:hypothetical protein
MHAGSSAGERPDTTSKSDMPLGEHIPAVVIPYITGHDAGNPVQAQRFVYRHAGAEGVQGLAKCRQSGLVSLGVGRDQAIQKKIGFACRQADTEA